MKSMGVKRLRKKAEDRSVWATILRRHWLKYNDRIPKKKKGAFIQLIYSSVTGTCTYSIS
jgi:hypothetical protein